MSKAILALRDPINLINNLTTNQPGLGALDASMGKTIGDKLSSGMLPFTFLDNRNESDADCMDKLDNPSKIFERGKCGPYCMMYNDISGASWFGGGIALIIGSYTGAGDFGAQLFLHYNYPLQMRCRTYDKWGAWKNVGGGGITT